jgi:1-deoxy-D-xylulose-5-phosphate reductoisomerase
MKQVIILGATGSIGRSAIDVCTKNGYQIAGVSANRDVAAMEQIVREHGIPLAVMADEKAAMDLRVRLSDTQTVVLGGANAMRDLATWDSADIILNAVVGIAGLLPTLSALHAGKDVALANKETLVTAGDLVNAMAKKHKAKILPVDSEHSAIFQCLQDVKRNVKSIILTASGGPFYGYSSQQLRRVTREQALKHPNWSMGAKITIDSATMMNKGLELIEAVHLFDVTPDQVEIVVHRQSIVHSMVRFEDNSVLAQMGVPDMRLPIQYALAYPESTSAVVEPLDLLKANTLTFGACDEEAFRAVKLARKAIGKGGTMPAILNGANECAVAAFLADKIPFYRIPELVEEVCETVTWKAQPELEDILEADRMSRQAVSKRIEGC